MDNKEFAKVLLCEASELLNEAVAADKRKEISKDIKKTIKKNPRITLFLKGKMNKSDADAMYKSLNSELKRIEDKINTIPKETTGEVITSYMLSQFTGEGLIASIAAEFIAAGTNPTFGAITDIFAFNKIRETADGEKNWNKAVCQKAIAKLRYKIDKAYNKYYANKSQNESIAVLLTEAALLLNDED